MAGENYSKLAAAGALGAVLVGVPFFILGGIADPFFAAAEVSAANVGAAGAVTGFAKAVMDALA